MGRPLMPVTFGTNSFFSPALVGNGTIIVFVHGFKGKAYATWEYFQDFIDEFSGLREADVLYYGYSSRIRMQNIAFNLRHNLNEIWFNPSSLGPRIAEILSNRNDTLTAWQNMILVAHSLGAVVVRRALLDSLLDDKMTCKNSHWSRNSTICLFAPAHSGASLLRLVRETFVPLAIPVLPLFKGYYPCLQDLEIGSQALEELKQDFFDIPKKLRGLANATSVILAEKDLVVEPNRFPGDPIADQIEGRGHVNVCKPDGNFVEPVLKICQVWEKIVH